MKYFIVKILNQLNTAVTLRLQDTFFGILRKIATARSISVQFSSNFHQIFTKCSPVHAKYGKVVKLTNNKIM
jgi:hypothetical protein